jgi:hypothetical protein
MSIAIHNRLKELEQRLDEQRAHNAELQERIADLVARVALLEAAQRVRKAPQAA